MDRRLTGEIFRILFERSPDASLFIEDNRFVDCNAAAVSMLRAASREQVLNTHPSALSPELQPDGRSSFEKADEMIEVALREGSHRFEWTHRRMDGEEFLVEVSLTVATDEGGKTIIHTVWRDISHDRQNELAVRQSRDLFRKIIDFLPDPAFMIDGRGTVMFWNKAVEKLTGVRPEDIVGKGDYEYAIPFYGERRPILIDLVAEGIPDIETKYPFLRREDDRLVGEVFVPHLKRYLNGSASVLRDSAGGFIGAIESLRDITDEKRTQEELIAAREAAESAARVKSDFLANMSHEIRTPMNAIIGLSHLLSKTGMNDKQRDYLDKIHDSAQLLLGIINDILDFSKIEAGKLSIESAAFNLEDVLDNAAGVVGHAAHKKGLEIFFDIQKGIPVFLLGDSLRLGQILINLVNNAIKFTENGHILINVDLLSREEEGNRVMLRFAVKDTGIGITGEQKTRLFQSFSQADTSITRRYGGTGLGLAIVKKLVELMGGSIGFESEYGRGSCFFFTLPFQVQEEHAGETGGSMVDLRGTRVLLVDDSDVSLDILEGYLEAFDCRVTRTMSGREALELIEKSGKDPFGLILVDWKMPGLDGVETISRMKDRGILDPASVIIMVSAFGMDEIREAVEGLDVRAFLTKPVNQSKLFDTLMDVFSKAPAARKVRPVCVGPVCNVDELAGKKVLLVEDNAINQQVAAELLGSVGLAVTVASDGRQAVKMIGQGEFDCVLMDLQMPVMDGYEATRIIRSMNRYKDIPIIAMTAHTMVGDRERCIEAGMNDHTPKPINPELLFATLARWLCPGRPAAQGRSVESPPVSEALLPADLPGIDRETALKRLAGNQGLFVKILVEFSRTFRDSLGTLDSLLEGKRTDEALRLAHTVKGTAGNIGAVELQQAAASLERVIKEGSPGIADAVAGFRREMSVVLDTCASLPKDEPVLPAGRPSVDEGQLREAKDLLQGLQEKIRENSFSAGELFEGLRMRGIFSPGEMTVLGEALNNFDFDAAAAAVRTLVDRLNRIGGK